MRGSDIIIYKKENGSMSWIRNAFTMLMNYFALGFAFQVAFWLPYPPIGGGGGAYTASQDEMRTPRLKKCGDRPISKAFL